MAEPDHITTLGKSPAFQFYPSDFVSGTIDLSTEDVGAYIRLLCYQWEKGNVPSNMTALGRIAGLTTLRMKGTWSRLRRHFTDGPDSTFLNRRLEQVRQGQIAYRRRQADNGSKGGRPKKPEPNPTETQPKPTDKANGNPNESSSVFSLQALPKKSAIEEPLETIACDFNEQYPALYARVRDGARYVVSRAVMDRELDYARDLARGWPDLKRLLEMAEVFLLMDIGDKNRPGTLGQFLHMAPSADGLLRKNGR